MLKLKNHKREILNKKLYKRLNVRIPYKSSLIGIILEIYLHLLFNLFQLILKIYKFNKYKHLE